MPAPLDRDLQRWFGLSALRPPQRDAIDAIERRRDTVVLLPTGGGKSMCFQLPAVRAFEAGRGTTLVVSPLVALMDDQVAALRARGIDAVAVHSHLDPAARRDALAAIDRGVPLVYASPERLSGVRFRQRLARAGVALMAVDEAHCISEWGHDFRPRYRELCALRQLFDAPVAALTATATPRVVEDIVTNLQMSDPVVVRSTFARPNLRYEVELVSGDRARVDRVAARIRAIPALADGSGRAVVYVATRKRSKAVATALRRHGIPADWYHAGRTPGARARVVQRYEAGAAPVLVATTAFGMGMDRPDVRLVIHAEAPGSLEAYAQQAGRAGRDGAPASCVLLWSAKDAVVQQRLRGPTPGAQASWRALERYVLDAQCRERALAAWFGDEVPPCGRCDACLHPARIQAAVDAWRTGRAQARARRVAQRASEDAVVLDRAQRDAILAFVDALERPVGKRLVAMGLRGSTAKAARRRGIPNNPHRGALRGVPERAIVRTIEEMLASGELARRGKKYPTVWMPDKRVRPPRTAPTRPRRERSPLETALRSWRRTAARRRRWKPYQVFPDKTLAAIVQRRPSTPSELLDIPGMGPKRLERFGDELLRLVAEVA